MLLLPEVAQLPAVYADQLGEDMAMLMAGRIARFWGMSPTEVLGMPYKKALQWKRLTDLEAKLQSRR